MSKKNRPQVIEKTEQELSELRDRIKNHQMNEEDYATFDQLLQFFIWAQRGIQNSKITIRKLRDLLFGSKSEKRKRKKQDKPLENKEQSTTEQPGELVDESSKEPDVTETQNNLADQSIPLNDDPKKKRKGHGRLAASAFIADEVIIVADEKLKPGDPCPTTCGGRVYLTPVTPGGIIRVKGQACAHVVSYEFHILRCALCGETFRPVAPPDFTEEKYDAYFKANLVLQKYFVATPFYRQTAYQAILNFPLPEGTQCDLVKHVFECAKPVFPVLEQLAANFKNLNHDDTRLKILDVIRENRLNPGKERTGMYTTCIVAQDDTKSITLYYCGIKHGGEHMAHLLAKRDNRLAPPIQMCDALAANVSGSFQCILCNCLSHARRKFTEIETFFPAKCGYILDQLGIVYANDDHTKTERMTPEQRLQYHQTHSAPAMQALKSWLDKQASERTIEPNSALGRAVKYLKKHWDKLTRFLSVAGAPLDNNITERALKLAIRIRKNAMFHKTIQGAEMAALFLTIIATCQSARINPLHYLIALQNYSDIVQKNPEQWLPWNYEKSVENVAQPDFSRKKAA